MERSTPRGARSDGRLLGFAAADEYKQRGVSFAALRALESNYNLLPDSVPLETVRLEGAAVMLTFSITPAAAMQPHWEAAAPRRRRGSLRGRGRRARARHAAAAGQHQVRLHRLLQPRAEARSRRCCLVQRFLARLLGGAVPGRSHLVGTSVLLRYSHGIVELSHYSPSSGHARFHR
jgi:hypothetical protein